MTEVKDTAARFVAAFNAHDEKALNLLHAEHIKFEAPGGFKVSTAHEATAYSVRWFKAFPNGKMTVHSEIVSAPWIAQEVVMEGIHTGPLEGPTGIVQPTHKRVVGKSVQLLRIENGKIVEARIYFDMLDQLTQLGLIPTPVMA
jgi:predicted ester cyclase